MNHECSTRDCFNPAHLTPSTARLQALEARIAKDVTARIRLLEDALREIAPNHPALPWPPLMRRTEILLTRREQSNLSDAARTYERSRPQREARLAMRFAQIEQVQRLVDNGTPKAAALIKIGISRSVHDRWRAIYDETHRPSTGDDQGSVA